MAYAKAKEKRGVVVVISCRGVIPKSVDSHQAMKVFSVCHQYLFIVVAGYYSLPQVTKITSLY